MRWIKRGPLTHEAPGFVITLRQGLVAAQNFYVLRDEHGDRIGGIFRTLREAKAHAAQQHANRTQVSRTRSAMFAAIDAGNISGAVYGVGTTPMRARADARNQGADGDLITAPITPAAAAFVAMHGGAPSRRLRVTSRGVELTEDDGCEYCGREFRGPGSHARCVPADES